VTVNGDQSLEPASSKKSEIGGDDVGVAAAAG